MRYSLEYDGERPETIEVGANVLVGTGCDRIRAGVMERVNADLVIGSQFLGTMNGVPAHRRVGQKTLDLFTRIGSRQACTDSLSGFRALSKKALDNPGFTS
ncbi:MAG: hypothetical protein STSR0009_30990 [Methanoregula sp.]